MTINYKSITPVVLVKLNGDVYDIAGTLGLLNFQNITPVVLVKEDGTPYEADSSGGGGSYTDEQAQDAVGTILADTATVNLTYADATPAITADVIDGSITAAKLSFDPATQAELDAHINDTTDAHAASAITNTPAGNIAATNVQTALNELDTEKAAVASAVMDGDTAGGVLSGTYPNPGFAVDMATQAELDAHVNDTSDAHDASAISVDSTTLAGTGTDVQAVLEELDNAIAAATGTPAGSNTEIQYNNAGAFGASPNFLFGANVLQVLNRRKYFEFSPYDATVNGYHFYVYTNVTAAPSGNQALHTFYTEDYSTDGGSPADTVNNLVSTVYAGKGGAVSVGTRVALVGEAVVEGCGNGDNEYAAAQFQTLGNIGTGYSQTTGPVGRIWGIDSAVYGPVAVRPELLVGLVQAIGNYYNGSPLDRPSAGQWIVTQPVLTTHRVGLDTFPVDIGLGIVGYSNDGADDLGFTVGIQIGGTGSPTNETKSLIGTGIHIRDYTTHGIKIDNASGSPTASIETDGNIIVGGLTASRPVIADAGKKLTVGTYSGNTTEFATVTGTKTTSQQLAFDASGNVIASGTAIGGSTVTWEPPVGMRLSAVNNTYSPTTDVTGAGTLYWTPIVSGGTGVVTGYNGSSIARKTVQQKSLALTITSGKIKNVYYDYDGDTLAVGADWTNDTTPSETLADEQGAIVLSTDHTKLYLGLIRADGTNTIAQSYGGVTTQVGGKQFVWNKWNQLPTVAKVIDTTDTWSYATATIRQANGATGNKVEYVTGDAASIIIARIVSGVYLLSNSANNAHVGVGIDSTTTFSGLCQGGFNGGTGPIGIISSMIGEYHGAPGLGYHAINWNESGADGTSIFVGDNGGDGWQTGMTVTLLM